MNISMYQASAPRFVNILTNLSAILDKAQAHVDARKIDPAALTTYRLFPDMHPMTRQVQIACDAAKGAVARLAGVEIPKHEDTEQTLADLKRMLEGLKRRAGSPPKAGLYFSCVGRGPSLFGDDSAELRVVHEALGDFPLVGFFGNGEISRDRLYGYTAVLTLFL